MRKSLLLLALSAGCALGMKAAGGPDAYGYTWKSSNDVGGPTYNWVDITALPGAVQVNGLADDNSTGMYNIGWDFHYYWTDVSQVKIGSNGWIGFNNIGNIAHCFPTVPTAGGGGDNYLAPFMSDLIFGSGGGNQGSVYYWSNNVDSFIVSYIDAPWWQQAAPGYVGSNTFQVILDGTDSSITFQYNTMTAPFNNTSGCASDLEIGIENITGNIGLEVYNEAQPIDGEAVKFYYPATVTFQVPDATPAWNANSDNAGQFFVTGSALDMTTNIANVGNADISTAIAVNGKLQNLSLTNVWTSTSSVSSLNAGANQLVTFPDQAVLSNAGQYYYKVDITNGSDINPSNNSNTVEVSAVSCSNDTMLLTYATGNPPDGAVAWGGGNTDDGAGVYMVPPQYPSTIDAIDFFILDWDGDPGTPSVTGFTADVVMPDVNGNPGASAVSEVIAAQDVVENAWNRVTLSTPVNITSGGFFVKWLMGGDSIGLGTEAFGPISRRSYEILSGAWATYRENTVNEMLIRAHVQTTCVVAAGDPVVSRIKLSAAPNPAHDVLTIAYETVANGNVSFRMSNIFGQEVLNREINGMNAGSYSYQLNASNFAPGVYFLTMETQGERLVQKIVIE